MIEYMCSSGGFGPVSTMTSVNAGQARRSISSALNTEFNTGAVRAPLGVALPDALGADRAPGNPLWQTFAFSPELRL